MNPNAPQLLRLLQLSSAALPVGAYAYSHGLEQAATRGWVTDEISAGSWICGLIEHSWATLDVPVLGRLVNAWRREDELSARRWMKFCAACRESAELAAEEQHHISHLFEKSKSAYSRARLAAVFH